MVLSRMGAGQSQPTEELKKQRNEDMPEFDPPRSTPPEEQQIGGRRRRSAARRRRTLKRRHR